MGLDARADHLLVISSDIPAAAGAQIDWVIERRAMEELFPGCRRTFFRFRDMEVCGGDLAVISTRSFSMDAGF